MPTCRPRSRLCWRARLQNVTGCWHDLAWTVDSFNKRSSMAEPGAWRVKRLDLFFPPAPEYFLPAVEQKLNSKRKGQQRTQ
jgi:hypothetical protein